MKSEKTKLKIAGIINIVIGLIASSHTFYCTFLILTGIFLIYISTKEDNEIIQNKSWLTLLSAILLVFNFISSILIFISLDNIKNIVNTKKNGINAPPTKKIIIKKQVVDPEVKKIDILLKLGVGMVFVSGILFATTSWDFINDLVKAIALLLFGVLFQGLSIFSEKKLKIYNTTYMYWLVSISFFLLTIVGMLYFGITGTYLTYNGAGSTLALAITLFTVAGLSLATYLKFSQKMYLFITYISSLFSIIYLLEHLALPDMLIIFIVIIISFLIQFNTNKDNSINLFFKIVSYVIPIYIFKCIHYSNEILIFITSISNIILVQYVNEKNKTEAMDIVSLILSYGLLLLATANFIELNGFRDLIPFIVSTVYTLVLKLKLVNKSKTHNIINLIVYSIIAIKAISDSEVNIGILCMILVSLIYMIMIIFQGRKYLQTESLTFAKYIEPFSIFMFIGSVLQIELFKDLRITTIIIGTLFVYIIIHYLISDKEFKKTYYLYIATATVLCILENLTDVSKIDSILIILPTLYWLFATKKIDKENKNKNGLLIVSYLTLLFNIENILIISKVFNIDEVFANILLLLIIAILIYIEKNDSLKKISYFAICIPLFQLMNIIDFSEYVKQIMRNILVLYITFLAIKFSKENNNTRNNYAVVGIIVSCIFLISEPNILIGLYTGILGLIIILIGFYKKEYKSLFATGIVITILNIIYQLSEVWERVPFWLYLLVGGLGIIGFVTYREVKKMK